eukprot:m.376635 g.376635  ORF g.376635 m.376635 type:complete len:158 (+) comp56190_c0_seq6:469-942(+)
MRSTTRVSSTFLFQIDRSCVFGSHILSAFLIHCVWLFPVWFDAVGDITHLLHEHWGEMFLMGGLAGIPFCGKTGFTAFSHHVPNNGNIFILFAPHVGITRVGERCGLIGRHGHEHLSPGLVLSFEVFSSSPLFYLGQHVKLIFLRSFRFFFRYSCLP